MLGLPRLSQPHRKTKPVNKTKLTIGLCLAELTALLAAALGIAGCAAKPVPANAPAPIGKMGLSPCFFDYCMGQKITDKPVGIADNGVDYIIIEPHLRFDAMAVYFTEQTGVCQLRGMKFIPEGQCEKREERYSYYILQIARKYGVGYDEPLFGEDDDTNWSLCNEEDHWVRWDRDNSILPTGLDIIVVEKKPNRIDVDYIFSNIDACETFGQKSLGF